MNTLGISISSEPHILPSASLTLQETQSIQDSMNIPKIECIAYIYINYKYLKYKNYF